MDLQVFANNGSDATGQGWFWSFDLPCPSAVPVEVFCRDAFTLQVADQLIETAVPFLPTGRPGDLFGRRVGIHTADTDDVQFGNARRSLRRGVGFCIVGLSLGGNVADIREQYNAKRDD